MGAVEESSPQEEEEDRYYEGDQMGAVERRCVAGGEGLLGFLRRSVSKMVPFCFGVFISVRSWKFIRLIDFGLCTYLSHGDMGGGALLVEANGRCVARRRKALRCVLRCGSEVVRGF